MMELTLRPSTSSPSTLSPASANAVARGRPTYPSPMTATRARPVRIFSVSSISVLVICSTINFPRPPSGTRCLTAVHILGVDLHCHCLVHKLHVDHELVASRCYAHQVPLRADKWTPRHTHSVADVEIRMRLDLKRSLQYHLEGPDFRLWDDTG